MLLGVLACLFRSPKQAGLVQQAAFSLVRTISRYVRLNEVLAFGVVDGNISGPEVAMLLDDLGAAHLWGARGPRRPVLSRPPLDGAVGVEWLVHFAFCHCRGSNLLELCAVALLEHIANEFEKKLPAIARDAPAAMSLPLEFPEAPSVAGRRQDVARVQPPPQE